MSPDERQAAIWDIVFQRNYETVPNLACELGREDMAAFTLHTSHAAGTGI